MEARSTPTSVLAAAVAVAGCGKILSVDGYTVGTPDPAIRFEDAKCDACVHASCGTELE